MFSRCCHSKLLTGAPRLSLGRRLSGRGSPASFWGWSGDGASPFLAGVAGRLSDSRASRFLNK